MPQETHNEQKYYMTHKKQHITLKKTHKKQKTADNTQKKHITHKTTHKQKTRLDINTKLQVHKTLHINTTICTIIEL